MKFDQISRTKQYSCILDHVLICVFYIHGMTIWNNATAGTLRPPRLARTVKISCDATLSPLPGHFSRPFLTRRLMSRIRNNPGISLQSLFGLDFLIFLDVTLRGVSINTDRRARLYRPSHRNARAPLTFVPNSTPLQLRTQHTARPTLYSSNDIFPARRSSLSGFTLVSTRFTPGFPGASFPPVSLHRR